MSNVPRFALYALLFFSFLVFHFSLTGCISTQPVIELSGDVSIPEKTAVIFFVDGMHRERFGELIELGELPNMERFFVQGGVGVNHAVSSMPAITYPNSVSLLTGCFPGHHDILGNVWFDRDTLMLPDYIHADSFRSVNEHFDRPTLYEILDDHYTVNVQFHTRKGVSRTFDNLVPTGIDWYTHKFDRVDRRVGETFRQVIASAKRAQRWPTVMTYYFPGVDESAHRYGCDSTRYVDALKAADHSIGLVCQAIAESALARKTYAVLMTDHSHVPVPPGRHFDLDDWLQRSQGISACQERLIGSSRERRLQRLQRYDAILTTDAGRRAMLYLPGPDGWNSVAEPQDIRRIAGDLTRLDAAGIVLHKTGDRSVHVLSEHGSAVIERQSEEDRFLYRVRLLEGDPWGWTSDPFLRSYVDGETWLDSRTWLEILGESRYPDFVPQAYELFESSRVGDIVVFAAEEWSFDNWKSAHGSCLAADMNVPLYFAGPGLPHGGRIDHARLVDIMPTILDLLGEHARLSDVPRIDGISIADELRHAMKTAESKAQGLFQGRAADLSGGKRQNPPL